MKYLLLTLVSLTSCNNGNFGASYSGKTEETFYSFLKNFKEVSVDDIKKVDFGSIANEHLIEDEYVKKFLCRVNNLCFYSNSLIRNKYFYLSKVRHSDEYLLVFYRKVEPPLDVSVYVSIIDKKQSKILSSLLIHGIKQEKFISNVKISENLKFTIDRTYLKSNFSESAKKEKVKSAEVYFIDKDGIFTLKE